MPAVTEREHLIRPGGLLAFTGVVAVVLYLLFPREVVFTSLEQMQRADPLSIAYLRLLVRSYPDNAEVRYHLARQLYLAGEPTRALQVLHALGPEKRLLASPQLAELYLNILLDRLYAARSADERLRRRHALEQALNHMLSGPLPVKEKRHIVTPLLPRLSLSARMETERWLLRHAVSPEEAARWRVRLFAHLWMAGRFKQAMAVFDHMAGAAAGRERKAWGRLRVRLWLAAGRPDRALNAARQLARTWPNDPAVLRLAIDVARQNGRLDLQQRWMEYLLRLQPHDRQLAWQLFQVVLGQGRLKAALALVPYLGPPEKLSTLQIKRIAQVHDWNGQVREGWHWWLRYARRTGRIADWRRAWRLAIGLGQLEAARALLERLQRRRPLTEEERNQLYGVYLALGETDKARRMLETEYRRQPWNAKLARRLYRLLVDMERLPEATAVLLGLEARGVLMPALRVELANMLWLQRAPELAYAALVHAKEMPRDPRYWRRRLELATYLERFDDAREIAWRLLQEKTVDQAVLDQLSQVVQGLILEHRTVEAARLLHALFRRTDKLEYGLQAVALALQGNRPELARRWLNGIDQPRTGSLAARWWALKAQLALRSDQVEQAVAAWEQAHVLAPDDPDIRAGLIWTLIDHVDRYGDRLRSYLDFFALTADRRPDVQPLLAYGYLALGNYRGSLHWFRVGLPRHRQDNDWLMAMAEALDKRGWYAYARRLQAHVWRQLRPRLLAGELKGVTAERALRLTRTFAGARAADNLTRTARMQLDEAGRLLLLLEWALADGRRIWAHYYLQRALAHGVHLPGWERLSLALDANDGSALEWALRRFNRLPVADRMFARQLLGRRTAALTDGLTALDARKDEQTIAQIRAMTVSIRSDLDNGVRLSRLWRHRDALDASGWGVTLARLYPEHALRLQMIPLHLTGRVPFRSGLGDQLEVRLGWRRWGRDWQLRLEGLHIGRRQRDSWGGRIEWFRRLDAGLGYHLTAAFNQRADYSDALWGWGLDSYAGVRVDYGVDSRTRLSGAFEWHHIDSAWGVHLGEGPRVTASMTYTLFVHDPTWEVGADLQWYRFDGDPLADGHLNDLFLTPPGADTILTREFGRIGISSVWYHGQVHRIAHEVPSPHWKLGVNLGYVWTRQVVDYGIEAGLGWRIEGDDELGLTAAFSSETVAGGPSFEVKLSYNRYMGR